METKEYAQGQTIFKVGESADGLFIIGSGEVGIYFPENREMQKPNPVSYTHLTLPTNREV